MHEDITAGNIHLRKATVADIPRLREVIEASVRGLQADDYTPVQIEGALASVYGVDSQLIADGTYFVVDIAGRAKTNSPLSAAAAGANGKLSMEAISSPRAKIRCWIPRSMRQRFERFSCTPNGRAAVSAA